MTAILSALGTGVTAQKILQFLIRKSPALAPRIQSALASGLSAEKILKWFSKDKNFDQLKASMEEEYPMDQNANPLVQSQNVRRQNLAQDPASVFQRHAPGAALGIGAAIAAPYASRAAQSMLSRALPPSLTGIGSQSQAGVAQTLQNIVSPNTSSGGSQPAQPPIPQAQASSSQQPPISSSVAQPQAAVQPEVKSIDVSGLLNKLGLTKHIEEIAKNVKDPKGVAAVLYNKFPKEMVKLQKEAGKPMEDVVAEYMGGVNLDVKPLDTIQEAPIAETKEPMSREEALGKFRDKIIAEHSDIQPIKKGSLAASPDGLGEVKAIRNGKAIIEIDGKKHQIAEEDLEPPLYNEEDIADSYEKLFKMIPEEHRSGFIQWAGYDDDRNVLGFIPRSGKYEELHNITPEEAQMIKEGKGVARTTGERTEGLWDIGGDTRGGIISQIIHDRKKKQKEQSSKQMEFSLDLPKTEKTDRGMKPIFDELEYPRTLSRERERKKKEEQRARKKKEKEDEKAKKRKK